MDKIGCIITYPVVGHEESTLKSAIRMGISRVILMNEEESYKNLFDRFGLATEVRPVLKDDVSLVISSVANLISGAKNDGGDVSVLLLPSDPVIMTGMYLAACMEKVKVMAPISDIEMQCLTMPLFPFADLNEAESFILKKIIESHEISTQNLLALIKKEGRFGMLCSAQAKKDRDRSALRHLQRILEKIEKMELLSKQKRGIQFIWKSTQFGKLIFRQGVRGKY